MKLDVKKMAKLGVLAAMSIVLLYLIRFPIIPMAPFLEYEPADVPILVATFIFGPISGLLVTFVVALVQAFTVSASSGWVGFVMHLLATGTLVIVSGFIYKRVHSLKGAIIGLIAGSLGMTLMMIPCNLFFTVIFLNAPYEYVKSIIVPAIIPFNLIKAFANSAVVMLVYKSVGRILRASVNEVAVRPAGKVTKTI